MTKKPIDVVKVIVEPEGKPRKVGRPSGYSEQSLLLLLGYLSDYALTGDPVPTIEGACDELEISKQCFYEWAEAHPEFGDAATRLKNRQGRLLQAQGLSGKTNPLITKLMLSANHGMAEKSEQKQEHSGEIRFSSADRAIADIDSSLKQ